MLSKNKRISSQTKLELWLKGVVTRKLNRIWLKYNLPLHVCIVGLKFPTRYSTRHARAMRLKVVTLTLILGLRVLYAPYSLHLINILRLTKLICPNSFNACQSFRTGMHRRNNGNINEWTNIPIHVLLQWYLWLIDWEYCDGLCVPLWLTFC